MSGGTYNNLGLALYVIDRLEEAEEACRKALELSPKQVYARATLALILISQRRVGDALAEASLLEPEEPMRIWLRALIHHCAGRSIEADEALHELVQKHASTSAYRIAQVYAMRGQTDSAFEWLERAYAQHDAGLSHARIVPLLRALHADPRWRPFMSKMGLADADGSSVRIPSASSPPPLVSPQRQA